jgi:hypothetical protein
MKERHPAQKSGLIFVQGADFFGGRALFLRGR